MRRLALVLWLIAVTAVSLVAQAPRAEPANPLQTPDTTEVMLSLRDQVMLAATRLPLAVALGAALALRPRRRATPPRTPAVVETQIILAVVGALIMLIVGASLARAFGIVGVASLIRYRSKIDDPKDAVVMLSALAVGLAAGVGLYLLSILATGFLVILLWIIESFEPRYRQHFGLTVTAKGKAEDLVPQLETVLRRYRLRFENRVLSADEVSYDVKVPLETQTDPISHKIVNLVPDAEIGVAWDEKKVKTK
jgi:uncharacterized membrane protein YhiD involved in acid resistance